MNNRQLIINFTYDSDLVRCIEAREGKLVIVFAYTADIFIYKLERFFKQSTSFNNSKITCKVSEDYITGAASDRWFDDVSLIVSEVVNPHNKRLGLPEVELEFMKP